MGIIALLDEACFLVGTVTDRVSLEGEEGWSGKHVQNKGEREGGRGGRKGEGWREGRKEGEGMEEGEEGRERDGGRGGKRERGMEGGREGREKDGGRGERKEGREVRKGECWMEVRKGE